MYFYEGIWQTVFSLSRMGIGEKVTCRPRPGNNKFFLFLGGIDRPFLRMLTLEVIINDKQF